MSPRLAYDVAGTVAEARRLFAALGRPNVLIKVPATAAGLLAITELIAAGINVNVTLIFALRAYEAVADAYLFGLEARRARGGDLRRVASVASFFISRVDAAVDDLAPERLRGQAAIANARLAYARFSEIFAGPRWDALAGLGAHVQRPLWASTSTKRNPDVSPTLYVDTLIGPHTVNTMPPATLDAFRDAGQPAETITQGVAEARAFMAELAAAGVDLDAVTENLLVEGVQAFADAFDQLLAGLAAKAQTLERGA